MKKACLEKYDATEWKGKGELWLDPEGNEVDLFECSMKITSNVVFYTWLHEGEPKEGRIELSNSKSTWIDSWHQPEAVTCHTIKNSRGLFTLEYSYSGNEGQSWGWRINLSIRPNNSPVLQMTNIAPWGEEGRAVRMIFDKSSKA